MAAARRIYIIGFMGCGKSTAGKKLAADLGWKFIDLDKKIESIAGHSIAEIFASSGEEHFRKLESETLTGLKTDGDTVISSGGGTPCFAGNMDYMKRTGIVVYLRMTPGQLKSRLEGSERARPLINNISSSDLLEYISGNLSEREKFYLQSVIIVDGIDLDIKALSNNIKIILNS